MFKSGEVASPNRRRPSRRTRSASLLVVAAVLLTTGAWWTLKARPARARVLSNEQMVARGEYLVTITSCNDCHTPFKMGESGPEPDMSRRLSGHPEGVVVPTLEEPLPEGLGFVGSATNTAFIGPWGISYSVNLTPDDNTGLGIWTEEIFINTLRSGRHWGVARPILPPMPWQFIGQMTDEDLRAVYAYLRVIPPIHNRVPEAVVAPAPAG